jgi:hypothetical protein
MADPEIAAISAVADAIADLEPGVRARVLRWASERYGVALPPTAPRAGASSGGTNDSQDVTEEEISAEAPTFEHFADLFNAAGPKTNDDKALVAGYWFQAVESRASFKATDLQRELKNLGHAIPNITEALTGNIKKKPARVLQLAKSGSSKQARKTYKLTHEGLVYVQGMIGHSD